MTHTRITLGDKVRDKLSGFEGTADGYTEFLNGCVSYRVTSSKLKDGEPNRQWFDENDLEVTETVEEQGVKLEHGKKEHHGGGAPPPRRAFPSSTGR